MERPEVEYTSTDSLASIDETVVAHNGFKKEINSKLR